MPKRDYYEILGISKSADSNEIRKAYKKLAKKYHPDLNPGNKEAEANFKEVNEAYEVLSNAEKKARYDQFGDAGVNQSYGGPSYSGTSPWGSGWGAGSPFGEGINIGDIFEDFFGGGFGGFSGARRNYRKKESSYASHGSDIEISLSISFVEAAKGCKKRVSYNAVVPCSLCKGTGSKNGNSGKAACSVCGGSGQQVVTQRSAFGVMQSVSTCSKCHGSGKVIKDPCNVCCGTGCVKAAKHIDVTIPAGINDGQILNVTSQGNAGENGGTPGNLHIYVTVAPHQIFTRKGYDVYCDLPITFAQASLGAELIVPTLDGKVSYSIPAGTQPGDTFKLRNKGIIHLNSTGHGDQYVKVLLEVPRHLTSKQQDLLKSFDETLDASNYYKRKGFFKKLKEFFGD